MSAVVSLVGLVMMGTGIGVFPYTAKLGRERRQAMSWPRANGRILQSEVTLSTTAEGAPSYGVRIRYQFELGGRTFEGDRIQWGPQVVDGTEGGANAIAARYPLGAAVQVVANPQDPTQSALEIASEGNLMSYYGLGVGLLVVGLVLLASS